MEGIKEAWGPWVGVPKERRRVCAVVTCQEDAGPQICPFDGRYHHHGCVHYDTNVDRETRVCPDTGLVFREGWGWLCDEHYQLVCAGWEARRAQRVS